MEKKRIYLYFVSAIIVGLVVSVVLVFPNFFMKNTTISQLAFVPDGQAEENGTLLVSGAFSQDIPENETVWIYAENAGITITVKGQVYPFEIKQGTPSFLRSPGNSWYSFSSLGIEAGEKVEIAIHSYYGENSKAMQSLFANMYMGDGSGLYRLMLERLDFLEITLLLATIASIMLLCEGALEATFGIASNGIRVILMGFYFFSGGLWCITDIFYPFIYFVFGPPWLTSLVDVSGLLLFPIALALLMRFYMRGKKMHRVMTGVLVVEIATAAICLLLQFAGVADLFEQQFFIGVVAVSAILTSMVCVVLCLIKNKDNYLLLLFLSVLPVLVCEIVDGLNILWDFMPRRMLMIHGFALSIILLMSQFISYSRAESKREAEVRQMERELADVRISVMLSQIQPHFLYNALSGIKELCDSNMQQASEALEHFAYYLRGNLEFLSDSRLIPFEKEMAHISDYLYLEKMRFPQKLKIKWKIHVVDFLLPPLTVQPIIENAIRHGIVKKKEGGTLEIKTVRTADEIIITVQDDGVGFDTSAPPAEDRPHVGIENTRNRLKTLCDGIMIIDSEKGVGTTVKIILPRED